MDIPSYNLFQLEDGSSLVIAVHSEVPQHGYLCDVIRANRGLIVEDVSTADFCLVSLVAPGVDGIVEELRAKGKFAIHDYWLRDSVHANRLLPWYSYQIAPTLSISIAKPKNASRLSAAETEERDVHEIVATAARYSPLLPAEELYRYVSRKCPHRSITSLRQLHEARKVEIDSRLPPFQRRLESALTFDGAFGRRPNMHFGSPVKERTQLCPEPPSVPAPLPAPTSARGNEDRASNRVDYERNENTDAMPRDEEPYEPPNIDESFPSPGSSPPPSDLLVEPSSNRVSRDKATVASATDTQIQPRVSRRNRVSTVGVIPIPGRRPITYQDKYELAKFLAEQPASHGTIGRIKYFEIFRKTSDLACLRSAKAWATLYGRHKASIESIMRKFENGGVVNRRESAGEMSGTISATSAMTTVQASGGNRKANDINAKTKTPAHKSIKSPKSGKHQRIPVTEGDKQALAEWMLDHPKDRTMKKAEWFEMFMRQVRCDHP